MSGFMRRAYNAVKTEGGGRANVACSNVGFLVFSPIPADVLLFPFERIGSLMSLYPLTRCLKGMLGVREGMCPSGTVE